MKKNESFGEQLSRVQQENTALKTRVEELTDFIENASIPLHWVDEDGIITWANQAELDMLGYEIEEYIGLPISNFHVDSDVIANILKLLRNNETLRNYPARLRSKDGAIIHVSISSNALMADGKFIHSRCFTTDVTAIVEEGKRRDHLVHLLERSEERLRLAIKATKLGTWDWNIQTATIYLSKECRHILRLRLDELFTIDNALLRVHPDDRRHVQQIVEKLKTVSSKGSLDLICRLRSPTGARFNWIQMQGTVYYSRAGRPQRAIGSILDVTDVKLAEAKSAQLAAIVKSTHDAIIGKTLDGYIISWNDAAERIFGYSAEEMVGKSILRIIPDDRYEEEDFIITRLKNGESVEHFETKRRTKDGHLLDLSLTISPIRDDEGNIIGISKIARDISEKKQEEQRKNDFVTMVSHELRTPLTSILLYAQLIIKNSKNISDGIGIQMAPKIVVHAKKMMSMISDFLNLAKIEEGEISISKAPFEIFPLVEEITEDARQLSAKHEIKLVCDPSVNVYADRDKIGQVITNLVSNAIKYSPAGGVVEIGCENVQGKIKIYVRDEGMGISAKDQKKLFRRFSRVDSNEIKNISGFGIGLFLVSEILRHHNSLIEVQSELGAGAIFYFDLDAYQPRET
ncbi:PAS domain-containing sensor histidine kinase [Sphingobacterium sp. SYP-B4668]|uniref:PAS domain-containing sensor histidine kinase n=1 Tax=Sphingobacterium sp. SYP-B4668 TaxID=2996035 RepID=UPI0022DD1749|nr:PAS domain S-box protein [Sphingobacterium sp. SYP-B4668]